MCCEFWRNLELSADLLGNGKVGENSRDTVPFLLFRQAWATMIDVEGGANPIIKDTALDSKGGSFKKC